MGMLGYGGRNRPPRRASRSACSGTRTTSSAIPSVAAAQPGPLPAAGVGAGARRLRRATRRRSSRPTGTRVHARGPHAGRALLQPARRAVPGRSHRGHVRLGTDRADATRPTCSTSTSSRPTTRDTSTAAARSGRACSSRPSTTELERLVTMLDERFPGEYVLFVTADHGQCPLPDSVGGVRLDPIQLDARHRGALQGRRRRRAERGAAARSTSTRRCSGTTGAPRRRTSPRSLKDYRYRDNIGPYVPRNAVEVGPAEPEGVLGGVRHDLPRHARRGGSVALRRHGVPGRRHPDARPPGHVPIAPGR